MASDQTAQVPAGWYPDPYEVSEMRWWDGQSWTESVHPPTAPAASPAAPAMPAQSEQAVQVEQAVQAEQAVQPEPAAQPEETSQARQAVYTEQPATAVSSEQPAVQQPAVQQPEQATQQAQQQPAQQEPAASHSAAPLLAPPQPGSLLPNELLGEPFTPAQSAAPAAPEQASTEDAQPHPLVLPEAPEALEPPAGLSQDAPLRDALSPETPSEPSLSSGDSEARLPSRREMRLRKKMELEASGGEPEPALDAEPGPAAPAAPRSTSATPADSMASTPVPDSSTPTAFDWLPGANSRGLDAPPAPTPTGGAFTPPVVAASPRRTAEPQEDEIPPTPVVNAWSRSTAAPLDGSAELAQRPTATRKSTVAGWFIAVMPLIGGILSVGAVKGQENYPRYVPAGVEWWMLVAGVVAVLYIVTILLAASDYRKLDWAGYYRPAHWAWSILTAPVYLLVRMITVKRETGRTSTLLWVWLLCAALLVGSWFAAGYFAPDLIEGYTLPFL